MPEFTAARVPFAGLAALAPLRDRPGVRVAVVGDVVWVTWPPRTPGVVECVRPVAGSVLFARRGTEWFRHGERVPTSAGPPADPGKPLDAVIVPARFDPVPPPKDAVIPVEIRLVRDGAPRPATALGCTVPELVAWADSALTADLRAVTAARSGERVIVRGSGLPVIPGAVRFWGETVLVPLGFQVDPPVAPAVLRAAAGAEPGDVLVLSDSGANVVPADAFGPVTRAGARLAAD